MNRKQQREAVFHLLFESDFKRDETPADIFAVWCEENGEPEGEYISNAFFGVHENMEQIDAMIERHSNGWKVARLARVSRAIIRLCTFEMMFADVPNAVAINEAIELTKKYDDDKARSFTNGVLGGIKAELEADAK